MGKKNTADRWQHIILCTRRGYDYLDGVEFHSRGTDKSNRKNDGTLHPTARLPRGGKSKISRVGHGNEYTLQRVVPFRNKSVQQSLRTFFHGMDAKKWRANQIKWRILCKHDHLTICGAVSNGSRAGRSLPQLSGRYNFLANINRPWASPAKNAGTLR